MSFPLISSQTIPGQLSPGWDCTAAVSENREIQAEAGDLFQLDIDHPVKVRDLHGLQSDLNPSALTLVDQLLRDGGCKGSDGGGGFAEANSEALKAVESFRSPFRTPEVCVLLGAPSDLLESYNRRARGAEGVSRGGRRRLGGLDYIRRRGAQARRSMQGVRRNWGNRRRSS